MNKVLSIEEKMIIAALDKMRLISNESQKILIDQMIILVKKDVNNSNKKEFQEKLSQFNKITEVRSGLPTLKIMATKEYSNLKKKFKKMGL